MRKMRREAGRRDEVAKMAGCSRCAEAGARERWRRALKMRARRASSPPLCASDATV